MPMKKLVYLSIGGAAACAGMVYIFNNRVSDHIKSTAFYREAMDALRQHKGALYLLGQPIQDFKASFNSPGLFFNNQSDVRVNVIGPKSDGIVFFTLKPDSDEKLFLSSIQLQIGKDDSKRLIIKKSPDEEMS